MVQASASEIGQFQSSDLEGFSAKQTQEFLDKLLQQQVRMIIMRYQSYQSYVLQSLLTSEHLRTMDAVYQMNSKRNAEIRFR